MKKFEKDTDKYNIKALVGKYIKEILEQDVNHFKISKYNLCNLILMRFSLNYTSNFSENTPFEEREYLQFTLHKENVVYYSEMKKNSPNMSESEMIREIFSSYAILPPFLREIYLFREKIAFIVSMKKEYKEIKFHTSEGIVEGRIEELYRNRTNNYLEIKINSRKYYVSQIEITG
ncbi:MAG: DeoR family transcriptional regulator [Fusobacterium gastrosuis]|uniref:DeoR family transcriptional regulator n=1 Tax=Fusobacterium TaxID=848 RepID=UPI0025C3578E|nr:DeoR family transcriptional regulator [Fusobacterium sp.]MCI5725783.1 DeoR family transcriptional regulator [Fusobacterium sp.]MCI7222875.1 DeoR family transcriptional regulator [Fusobacterium sp.]MDY4011178.1 DeoR family transcriptional regulator [Fusobacterium gastrosuis]